MKLIIQIPCFNEEVTLPLVLRDIPRHIEGIDRIEVLIIDDACTDKTVEVARAHGVKYFVHHRVHKGLAAGFRNGINKSLELGADIIVNTDGDNQYPGSSIPDLVRPILEGRADMAIGDRQVKSIAHFSPGKKLLQVVGTKILNMAAGTKIPDAPSGFRAYSRDAALQLNVVTRFSYAMETLIQAGNKQLGIASVPIVTNPKTRESRLFKSSWEHVRKSGMAIVRAFLMYKPTVLFVSIGCVLLAAGLIPFVRFLYLVLFDAHGGAGHLQSLLIGSVLLIVSFIMFSMGVIADLIRINRVLIEETLEQTRRQRFDPHR